MPSRDHTELANPFDRSSVGRRWWLLGAIVTIGLLPLLLQDSYWRTNLVVCPLNVMLAIGLDFILGYAGQLNLGHSAFYGIGAYVSTLVITKLGLPFWVAFLCGIVLAGGAGMGFLFVLGRVGGHSTSV